MDMQAAQAAGAIGIGVLTGFDNEERLSAAGAQYTLQSVADLPNMMPEILAMIEEKHPSA